LGNPPETLNNAALLKCVYVGPLVPHQFINRSDANFGFFCMVSAARDISQKLAPDELARLMASPAGAFADPYSAPLPRKR